MITPKRQFGDIGEQQATTYLTGKGYKILARNFSCTVGEVDIIATIKDSLVFIEVKTRSTAAFGGAAAAVTTAKQKRVAKAAIHYIKANKPKYGAIIFDIIAITEGTIEHIQNAFVPQDFTI